MAQQARPKVIGQSDPLRAQLTAFSSVVRIVPALVRAELFRVSQFRLDEVTEDQRACPERKRHSDEQQDRKIIRKIGQKMRWIIHSLASLTQRLAMEKTV